MSQGWSTIDNWVSRLSPSTAKLNRYFLGRWIEWVKAEGGKFSAMSPDELIAYQRSSDNGSKYDLLDVAQRYAQSLTGRFGSKNRVYTAIRSFFAHNRAELPRDPGFTLRADVPRVVGTLTAESLKNLILSCKPVYRAIFLSIFQGGLDLEGFVYWNLGGWAKLREDLKGDPDVIRIDLPGRKRAKNKTSFFTFIGGDAIKAIRDYLPLRPQGAEAIFCDQFKGPIRKGALSFYWDSHLRKIGLIPPGGKASSRYGLNRHEMRDLFRTSWSKSGASPDVAEFCLQHQIDPMNYNKIFNDPAYMKGQYKKALPHLQIMSSNRPFNLADEEEVDLLRNEIEKLRSGHGSEVEKLKQQLRDAQSQAQAQDNFVKTDLIKMMEDSRKQILEVVKEQREEYDEEIRSLRNTIDTLTKFEVHEGPTREVGKGKISVLNWKAIDSMKSAEQKARERAESEAYVKEVEKKVEALEKKKKNNQG